MDSPGVTQIAMRTAVVPLAVVLAFTCSLTGWTQSAHGRHGVVATVDDVAGKAGIAAMKQGGNAVDAAVAAALTLGVVNGFNSGIGGGCFILIRTADGRMVAIDGRETAPAAATPDMFLRNGAADPALSQFGALASGVPGELAALDMALKKCGRLSLREHLEAAAKVAEEGFVIDSHYADVLKGVGSQLARFDGTRAVFFKADGAPYREGEIFKQPKLAATYRAIARNGIAWFYGGPFGRATERWMKQNHGIMTAADFTHYHAIERQPISTEYRGYTVVSFPPPSSGGVHVLEILNMLETRDLGNPSFGAVDRIQFIAEAMKLAFADRAFWLGDPAFAKVPRGLISKEYARELAAKIKLSHVTTVPGHGQPARAETDIFPEHTTHISTADAKGNWVALTATVNTHFGSKVVIPGTGVVMNNEMDDFSAQPGVANYFGLIGAEANAIAPGKRPLSSMSPTLVWKGRKPILSVGAAGGPTIISQTVLNIVDILDLKMDVQSAIDAPKFHQQWQPDELVVERTESPNIVAGLKERGQLVRLVKELGAAQAVCELPDGSFVGAADPRVEGQAEAW
jgi:gamma-glutamyltranspeptidase/glutathione hydrolase